LCSPIRECDLVGNFNVANNLSKSKHGKIDLRNNVVVTINCDKLTLY